MENLFIGRQVIHLPTVDSTNNYAAKLLIETNVAEGTVIMADFQAEGRGQRGNTWQSKAGENLMVSYVLHPKFLTVRDQFKLSKAIALSIHDLLIFYGVSDAWIKWPNDVLVERRKIAGILIENNVQGSSLRSSVVGIGLNINQTDFPNEIKATSLSLLKGSQFNPKEVLDRLNRCLEARYVQLRSNSDRIGSDYLANLVGTKERIMIRMPDNTRQAVQIINVRSSGELIVEPGNAVYNMDEISLEI